MHIDINSSVSTEQLDILFTDLDLDMNDSRAAAPSFPAVFKAPKTEIPKKGNTAPKIPEKENQVLGNSPNFGNKALPKSGIKEPALAPDFPKKGNPGSSHHGRDLEKDKSVIRQLAWHQPEFWKRASTDPATRFKSRTSPVGGKGTSLSSSEAHLKQHEGRQDEEGGEEGGGGDATRENRPKRFKRKTNEEHARVRPSTWEDTTPLLKGVSATMALQERSDHLTTLRMTPHRKVRQMIEKGMLESKAQSPADWIRRRIVRHIENEVGRTVQGLTPEVIVVTEVSPSGTFHCHLLVDREDTAALRKAIRLGGFQWEENRQFQSRYEGGPVTPGWLIYAAEDLGRELSHMSMSRNLRQLAKGYYNKFRDKSAATRSVVSKF